MAHLAKYTRVQIGGMTRHYERAKKECGGYQTFGNQEIDVARSYLNYNLAPARSQLEFIKQRTSEVHCLNRADVNVMCSWVVTAPKGLRDDEYGLFFDEVYKFLNERYAGGSDKNVVSAYVHMDETTPHMHYAFVPVVWDKKKNIDKVSAKMVVHRRDLQTFHPDLEKHMAEVFGREIGILNEATKDGNRSVEELKRGTAQAELEKAHKELLEVEGELIGIRAEKEKTLDMLSEARFKAIEVQNEARYLEKKRDELDRQIIEMKRQLEPLQQSVARLTAVNAEYKAKKKYIAEAKKNSDISMVYPDYVKISKKTFGKEEYVTVPKERWEEKHVSANEVDYLEALQASIEKSMANFTKSQSGAHYQTLKNKIKDLEGEVEDLHIRTENLKDKNRSQQKRIDSYERQLRQKDETIKTIMSRVGRILGLIDGGEAQRFRDIWAGEVRESEKQQAQQKKRGQSRYDRGWEI